METNREVNQGVTYFIVLITAGWVWHYMLNCHFDRLLNVPVLLCALFYDICFETLNRIRPWVTPANLLNWFTSSFPLAHTSEKLKVSCLSFPALQCACRNLNAILNPKTFFFSHIFPLVFFTMKWKGKRKSSICFFFSRQRMHTSWHLI